MASTAYKRFLASQNSSLLADNASLFYVTTTTAIHGATEIIKHFSSLQKQVKKKRQDILSVIDGSNLLVFEVETELEFQTSGGAYLPGLDNFLSDRVALLPITHIVTVGDDGKIAQIRQQWDQASLLKQLEIIGKSGRNWPVRDSREQLAMIQTCLKSISVSSSTSVGGQRDPVTRSCNHSRNALRDPHASLQLFGPREEIEAAEAASVVSPYASNRPRQRGFTEILGDEPHGEEARAQSARSQSPSKAGQGKNHQPMRIFDGPENVPEKELEEDSPKTKAGSGYIRPDPGKYDHFDFADGSDPRDHPVRGMPVENRPKSKHDSQWSFDDFVTPQKLQPSKTFRHQDVRHWDTETSKDDVLSKPAGKARRDAETHFELQDDGERLPRQDRPGIKPRGTAHNEGLGLYENNLFIEESATPGGPKRALGNITNLKDRTKDFDAHFAMVDESPVKDAPRPQSIPEGRKKAVKQMDANWSAYDHSPTTLKENQPRDRDRGDARIHITGDGMGGKIGTRRDWLYDNDGGEGEKIHIAGDGMGGKKGTNRDWFYGGGGDDEPVSHAASRKGNPAAASKSFWDY